MVINYSKWDALELSDDSDVEVHPNVDKKSFIRAKQQQIHQERERRRHQIKTLKYERIINEGLTVRIDRLLTALKSHRDKLQDIGSDAEADKLVFQSMMEGMMESGEDRPPPPPEGVHEHIRDKPTYPQMMASVVDAAKKEVDASTSTEPRFARFIAQLETEKGRIESLTKELLAKLAELEKEEKRHITSDDLHEGFNYSNVRKGDASASTPAPPPAAASSSRNQPASSVELINPSRPEPTRTSTGSDADIEEGTSIDDDSVEASPLGKAFANIPIGDWYACLEFFNKNPAVLSEKESDGLLVEAFNSELDGQPTHAKQCVHQALLIQYCRQLGGLPGVQLFFKRITDKEHQAHKMFKDDVDGTYRRISTRAKEILKDRAENPEGAEGVEQIQLHAVDPNTTIHINVPPKVPTSEDPDVRAVEEQSRSIFDTFPPGLQRALESGELDEVNKVLAKMSVDEAEEVVGKLGEGGMLSMEEGVIDATTEEGRKTMEEIEKSHKFPAQDP